MNEDPDPRAAFLNCQSSFVLQDAYARDRVLQDELQELEDLRIEFEKYTQLLAFWDHILKMRKFGTPPEPPPPPPPPPYPALPGTNLLVGPPAPPKLVTPEEQTQQFLQRQSEIALRIAELIDLIGTCIPSATTTCGLSANEVRRKGVAVLACGHQAIVITHLLNSAENPLNFSNRPTGARTRMGGHVASLAPFLSRAFTPRCSDGDDGCNGGCAFLTPDLQFRKRWLQSSLNSVAAPSDRGSGRGG